MAVANAGEPIYINIVSGMCTENTTPQLYDVGDFASQDQCVVAHSGESFPFNQNLNVNEALNTEEKNFGLQQCKKRWTVMNK